MTAQTTGEPQLSITAVPGISLMDNPIRDYDWGSASALAMLQGRTPTGAPEAELWMGAHPAAPSDLRLDDGTLLPLPDLIERAAPSVLGSSVVARFGARLPFVMKILAIAKPLSLQVHPDAARAELIWAPDGSTPYVDGFHKPEMLVALEPVEVLYGFRPADRAGELISRLGSERLSGLVRALRAPGADAERLHAALAELVAWPMSDRAALVAEVAAGSGRVRAAGPADHPEAFEWVDRLVGLHPADPLVVAPLLFDLVRLTPGQSIFVPAGVPHSYLSGLGVEVLASSDNVLRAGLTSKPIAVDELLKVIDCHPVVTAGLSMVSLGQNEVAWRPPVAEFQMTRILLRGDEIEASDAVSGPQIVVCTSGAVTIRANNRTLTLTPGRSVFVTAEAGPLVLGGTGEVFRAGPGLTQG